MRLWSWDLSPFAGKVRVAAEEKGIELDLVEIHPVKRPARLKELNPLGRVPVLELDDGTPIRESQIICEWLEDTHPEPPLWPADPGRKGWARGWAKFVDEEIAINFFLGMRKQGFGLDAGDPEDIVEQLHGRIARRYPKLEAALGEHEGPWLCGEAFSYADICGMAPAVRLQQWRADLLPDPDEVPRVAAWMDALRDRPSAAAIERKGERIEA